MCFKEWVKDPDQKGLNRSAACEVLYVINHFLSWMQSKHKHMSFTKSVYACR